MAGAAYDDNNVFAKILRGEIPCRKVYEDAHALAFHDINPQAPVHVLVVPRRHVVSLASAAPEDAELLGRLCLAAAQVARRTGIAERGFRVVINSGAGVGQSVFHVHLHVLGGRPVGWPPG
jgi:histidine triad (HIT) family protein